MQPRQPTFASPPAVDDEAIDDILLYIEEERVVPVIGPELLVVKDNGTEKLLYQILAERLAKKLKIPVEDMPANFNLNDVAGLYTRHNDPTEVYSRLKVAADEVFQQLPAVPDPLRKLASIGPLNLFLSTTFDPLLERALADVRFNGENRALSIAQSPQSPIDLPVEWSSQSRATVYHLLGALSATANYVVTEADAIEFFHAIQRDAGRLGRLFDELRGRHLLVLGCGFPDWLTRFFLRIARGTKFQQSRERLEIVADRASANNAGLGNFLGTFSRSTRIFEGSAVEFVDRLYEKWTARHPDATWRRNADTSKKTANVPKAGEVFISYAKEDLAIAKRVYEALSPRVDVWMDQSQLEPGDELKPRLLLAIRESTLFLPIISATSSNRTQGWFIKEWKEAVLAEEFMKGRPYLVPIVVDDTPPKDPNIPGRFWDFYNDSQKVPAGEASPAFLDAIVRKVRDARMPKGTAP
jgi:hypothetical protein